MKYRSRTDLCAEILRSAAGGETTKTKIMYRAFLSYAQLKEYLSILIENGLLAHDSKNQTYQTTEKGRRFLNKVEQIDELMELQLEEKTR